MSKSGANDSTDADLSTDVRVIQAVVVALVPEFRQVRVCDADGTQYALTRATQGLELAQLREGQRLVCTVAKGSSRVLKAEVA